MKKTFKRWLLPLFTLLLIGGGAFMPFAVSALQDKQAASTVEIRQFTPVSLSLQLPADVEQVLQLMSNDHYFIAYDNKGTTNLSADQAIEIAKESLQTVSAYVTLLSLNTEADVETELHMAVSEDDSSVSALIWLIYFRNWQNSEYIICVDDASGKMVNFDSINGPLKIGGVTLTEAREEYIDTEAGTATVMVSQTIDIKKWQIFCQNYYGIRIVGYDTNEGPDYWQCILKYKRENSEVIYKLPLTFVNDSFEFNSQIIYPENNLD